MAISPIADCIEDLAKGRMVILVDDPDRENEGDLAMLAEFVTADDINFMAKEGRGLICMPLDGALCDKLELPMQASHNTNAHGTAFTISIEAASGVSTGISAADRAHTIREAVRPDATAADLARPGHVFPLRAKNG
ncbi:MAG: 3,4-dihydroxy-2-butanone-4-phosphate synthase, partial [Planctomycetota bacterium]|nr:3,4-dihydroxy-2-butanone-4-phosphate synthase [Planctomycetota bacterium]